jgi:hypothetical protein
MMSCLGHKPIKTTEIDSHLTDKHLPAVVNELPSAEFGHKLGHKGGFAGEGNRANR